MPLDGQSGIAVLERADQPRQGAQVAYNAYVGELYYSLAKGAGAGVQPRPVLRSGGRCEGPD